MSKKNLTKAASSAADKFFSKPPEEISDIQEKSEQTDNTNNTKITNNENDTKYTNIPNKSKHYDERGKREVRHGLLLDKQLKEDLTLLCYATGNRSINDYIVSLLIEHTEQPEKQKLLNDYRKLNKG
jgi:hypothetical protein